VARGGIVFENGNKHHGSIVLMGDSNAAMYGTVVRDICADMGWKLTVIGVDAGDPLPSSVSGAAQSQLWLDSLRVVEKEKPACLILACEWEGKLRDDRQRINRALEGLGGHVGTLLILNQPPILPAYATRAEIRDGRRAVFYEEPQVHRSRRTINQALEQVGGRNCVVLDVACEFELADGQIRFTDEAGRQLYQDTAHLSGYGAQRVRQVLQRAMGSCVSQKQEK
jgi:hypothetical protein